MKRSRLILSVLLATTLMISSCITKKGITYLQYANSNDGKGIIESENRVSVTPAAYKVMHYDNLYIRVITPDPQWSNLFNIMPVGAGGTVTEESAALFGYPVDDEGNIEIPFVGKVGVAGKTLSEIKIDLDSVFKNYVTDAAISVRLVNNYVSVIGQVRIPGRYRLTKDRVNVFEMLAMAGDMNEFGDRQKVQIIRPSPYGPVVKEFSLSDRSILSSDLYYIMPNDIIYAVPTKGVSFRVNASVWSLFLTTITSTLGVVGFLRTL